MGCEGWEVPICVSGALRIAIGALFTLVAVQEDTLVSQLLVVGVGESSSLGVFHDHHNKA